MPSGNIAIWRQSSPDSWTTEYRKADGKLLSSDDWKLSPDGKNLSVTTSGVKANGDLYTDTAEYVRTAGHERADWVPGRAPRSSSARPMNSASQESGLDQLILKIPALKASGEVNFDGKEVAVQGPDIPTWISRGAHPHRALQLSPGAEIEWQRDFLLGIHRLRRWQDDDRGRRGARGSSLNWGLGKAITRVH